MQHMRNDSIREWTGLEDIIVEKVDATANYQQLIIVRHRMYSSTNRIGQEKKRTKRIVVECRTKDHAYEIWNKKTGVMGIYGD